MAESGLSPEQLEPLHEALAQLEMDSGPQIRAGINTLEAAREFAHRARSLSSSKALIRIWCWATRRWRKRSRGAGAPGARRGRGFEPRPQGPDCGAGRGFVGRTPEHRQHAAAVSGAGYVSTGGGCHGARGCHSLAGSLKERHGQSIDAPQVMKELVDISAENGSPATA